MTVADLRAELDLYPDTMPVAATWEGLIREIDPGKIGVVESARLLELTLIIDVE